MLWVIIDTLIKRLRLKSKTNNVSFIRSKSSLMKKKFAYWRTSSSHISAYQQLNCEKWPEYKILQRLDLMVWEGLLQLCCSPKYVANMFYEKCHWLQPKLQLIRNTGSTYHNSVKVCAVQGAWKITSHCLLWVTSPKNAITILNAMKQCLVMPTVWMYHELPMLKLIWNITFK